MKRNRKKATTHKREPISKKMRFDVFCRDNFKCTYCGQGAPDVVLHIDHVQPVAKGGSSDISNLTTACSACNGGKSDMVLGAMIEPDEVISHEEIGRMIENNDMLLSHLVKNPKLFRYAHKVLTLFYVADTEDPLVVAICNIINALDEHDQDIKDVRGEYEYVR